MISLDITIGDFNRLGKISVRTMNVCHRAGIKTLRELIEFNKFEFLTIRNCGKKTFEELKRIIEEYSTLQYNNNDNLENSELHKALVAYENLNIYVLENLNEWVSLRFKKLGTRTQHTFHKYSDISEIIKFVYSTNESDLLSIRNSGIKTQLEIESYLKDVKLRFESIARGSNEASATLIDERENEIAELENSYPFLLRKERQEIVEFIHQYNSFPYLYVAKSYIIRSKNPRLNIYRDFYGFNHTYTRYSLSTIAVNNNLTRERIRQIVENAIPIPKKLYDKVKTYLRPLINNIEPFDSLLWSKIQHENMLEEPSGQTARLVCALLDTHIILQIDDEDKEYLVRKSLLLNVKIKTVLNDIRHIIELRRTTIQQLDILKYIKSDRKPYHDEVSQLCTIYADFLRRKYAVAIEKNRIITMLPNAIDISTAIENILEQKGVPMSLVQLMIEFNKLHPTNAILSPMAFKTHIFRNKNIKPKGKTGMYVLNNWQNHFTGTLTSYLEYILNLFKQPIKLDDLVDFALDEFPNTNKKSIYTLITKDTKDYKGYKSTFCNLRKRIYWLGRCRKLQG